MSKADRILDLVVKAQPFHDIRRGFKKEEYREIHWAPKLMLRLRIPGPMIRKYIPYTHARVSLGYHSNRETFMIAIRCIRWGEPKPQWCYGIVTKPQCFIISFGEILENA